MKKLKRSVYKSRLLIALLAGTLLSGSAGAQYYEKSRHITKAFPVEKGTEIQVSNKYGTIHLMPWDKDSVRFEIDFTVKAKKESKVDKIFNYIDFSFTGTQYYVIAQTEINKSTFWTEVSDAASALFSTENKAQIDYTVFYPEGNNLKINNKFGNIYTTDHKGKLEINLSNGDLKAHDLNGDTKLILEFGNASINSMTNGNLSINYSEINLENADVLNVNSKSSTLYLGEISEMIVKSRRDKFNISEVGTMNGESSFTNFKIKLSQNAIVIKTEYGEFLLEDIFSAFNLLSLNSSFTDIQLQFPATFAYDLEINHDKRTIISYPSEYSDIQKKIKDQKEELYITYGKVGSVNDRSAKININNTAGTVTIKQQ